ncbi:MAG TPA: glycosyltransferase family 4 protein [Bryobacteraceae bacterium]|nr:glycosyltransferase family 4 protein [Bryobacteraceae bacterium]
MKILFINQFFWPDAAATGQFLEDLVRHLGAQGHDITVIASGNKYADAAPLTNAPPARILHVRGVPFARSVSGRALSYLSFFTGAFWKAIRCERPDVVVTMTTPPLLSVIGEFLQRLRGVRHVIWEMDLFPDALVSLQAMREGGWADRALGLVADYCRRRSDAIIALGPCMEARLRKRGIPASRIHVADNWADGEEIRPQPPREAPDLHILYSGNLGLSHDIDTIAGAMETLAGDPRFRFSFAGGGARRAELELRNQQRPTGNVTFLPYASRRDVAASLGAADIGLVTLRRECSGTVVPSKVYGLMAAGRPILFIGPLDASAARLVERHDCGWRVDDGDVAGLTALLSKLQRDRSMARNAGARARKAFENHYDIGIGVARIAAILGLPESSYVIPKCVSRVLET